MSAPRLTVIGGYLGAGKTTLMNRLLAGASGERVAVIVNDFGAINIDAGLIQSRDEDTIRLSNGCMCCSASDGMAAALAQILEQADKIDRIVIETSGVAEPGKVAMNAHGFRLGLDGVIVLADADNLPDQAANRYVGDVVRRQLAQADLILLNKIDLVDAAACTEVRDLIESAAPGRPVVEVRYANAPIALLTGQLPQIDRAAGSAGEPDHNHTASGQGHHEHGAAYRSWVVEDDNPMTRTQAEILAKELVTQAIRAKGHIHLSDDCDIRYLYQQVGRRWTLVSDGPWGSEPPRTAIVTIALAEAGSGSQQTHSVEESALQNGIHTGK